MASPSYTSATLAPSVCSTSADSTTYPTDTLRSLLSGNKPLSFPSQNQANPKTKAVHTVPSPSSAPLPKC